METSKEVVVKQNSDLAMFEAEDDLIQSQTSAADILIPRVLLAQKMSPIVDKPGTQIVAGDLYNSVTEEKILGKGQGLKIIPLYLFKTLTIKHQVNGKFEFKSTEPWKEEFEVLPWEFEEQGVLHKNIKNINLVCFREEDLDNPAALPLLISFRVTSLNCGKMFSNDHDTLVKVAKANFSQSVSEIYTELVTKDNNSYYVFKKKVMSKNPKYKENKARLVYWAEQFSKGLAKVDSEEKLEETEKDVSGGTPF